MSSIDPSMPSPSSPEPPPSAPSAPSGGSGDSLSPSLATGPGFNYGVVIGDITINQFVNLTQSPSREFKNTLDLINRTEPLIFSKFNQALAKNIANINQLSASAQTAQATWASVATTEQADADDYNPKASAYNAALSGYQVQDQDEVDTMNQAITDHENGAITDAEYNAIAANYNAYVASRNAALTVYMNSLNASIDTYNSHVDANNASINSINPTLADLGISPLPLQTALPHAEGLPTVPTAPYTSTPAQIAVPPPAASVTPIDQPPPSDQFTSQYVDPIRQTRLRTLSVFGKTLSNNERFLFRYIRYLKKGTQKNPIIPYAYQSAMTKDASAAPGPSQQSGSSPGLTAFATSLLNVHLTGTVTHDLISSTAQASQSQHTLPPSLSNQIGDLVQGTIIHAGLFSTNIALPLLAKSNGDIESNDKVVHLAAAAGFASQLVNSATSDALPTAIHEFLVNSGMDQSTVAQLEKPLTAAARLNLLQFGLLQIGLATNLPGLSSQILGNAVDVTGFPSSPYAPQTSDVLANPQSIESLRGNLAAAVALKLGVSDSVAKQLVDGGITTALASGSNLTTAEFNAAFEKGFLQKANDIKLNLNHEALREAAAATASNASAQVQSELITQNLDDEAVQQEIVDDQIFTDAQKQAILHNVLQTASNNAYETARELRDQVLQGLVNHGLTYEESLSAANQIAGNVGSRYNADSINRSALNSSLVTGLVQAGFPSQDAANIAANAIEAALGAALSNAEDIRYHIQKALRQFDVGTNTAKKIAEGAYIAEQNGGPLDQIGWGNILSPQALAEEVHNRIVNDLIGKVSSDRASQIAQVITAVLFGINNPNSPQNVAADSIDNPTSLLNLIKNQVISLNKESHEAVTENFKSFMKPTYSLVEQTLEKLDPANSVIHSFSADPFNAIGSNAISNYGKKSTDIPV